MEVYAVYYHANLPASAVRLEPEMYLSQIWPDDIYQRILCTRNRIRPIHDSDVIAIVLWHCYENGDMRRFRAAGQLYGAYKSEARRAIRDHSLAMYLYYGVPSFITPERYDVTKCNRKRLHHKVRKQRTDSRCEYRRKHRNLRSRRLRSLINKTILRRTSWATTPAKSPVSKTPSS